MLVSPDGLTARSLRACLEAIYSCLSSTVERSRLMLVVFQLAALSSFRLEIVANVTKRIVSKFWQESRQKLDESTRRNAENNPRTRSRPSTVDRLRVGWLNRGGGCCESRRCSRDTHPESHITQQNLVYEEQTQKKSNTLATTRQ
jgi:hypothetical protein